MRKKVFRGCAQRLDFIFPSVMIGARTDTHPSAQNLPATDNTQLCNKSPRFTAPSADPEAILFCGAPAARTRDAACHHDKRASFRERLQLPTWLSTGTETKEPLFRNFGRRSSATSLVQPLATHERELRGSQRLVCSQPHDTGLPSSN